MQVSSKAIGIFLTVIFFSAGSFAEIVPEYSAGARLGINISSIYGDTVQTTMARVGLNIGMYFTAWLTDKIALQQEAVIGTRGERWKDPNNVDPFVYTRYATVSTYLDLPLLVKWRFYQSDALRPAVYIGPTCAIALVAESEYGTTSQDMMEKTNRFDFGITAGFSMDIRQGNYFIPVDIRYNLGLTNYVKPDDYGTTARHGVLSVSVGLGHLLEFGKKKEKEF